MTTIHLKVTITNDSKFPFLDMKMRWEGDLLKYSIYSKLN